MYKLFFLMFVLFAACKQQQSELPKQETRIQDTAKIDSLNQSDGDTSWQKSLTSKPISNKPEYYEGIFIANLNTKTFRDCRYPDSLYWVIDDTKKLDGQFKSKFGEQSVYNSVYLKVKGDFENTENITTADKYPRTLRVKEVISMEKKNINNTCVPYDYWVSGSDSRWTLQISRFENLIELIMPSENKTYYFFYNEPVEDKGVLTYKSHNLIQRYNIEIRIKKDKCSDGVTDKVYEYSAEIDLSGDKKLKGCAVKGPK